MAKQLKTDRQIDAFISKVIREANHHAPGVAAIITPLSEAVRGKINLAVDKVEVYQRNGHLARTCWVTIGGNRYVFSYSYPSGKIELKARSVQGQVINTFDNNTSRKAITRQANAL